MNHDDTRVRDGVQALAQRLLDTANYLRGISAVVESMNKGTADSLEIAIQAITAVRSDLYTVFDQDADADPRTAIDASVADRNAVSLGSGPDGYSTQPLLAP